MKFSRCFAVLFVVGGAGAFGWFGENEPNAETGGGFYMETCLDVRERARGCPNAAPLDRAES